MYLLGIDDENVKRLKAGRPIIVDLAQMGGAGEVCITYGKTMADIVRELEKSFGAIATRATVRGGA